MTQKMNFQVNGLEFDAHRDRTLLTGLKTGKKPNQKSGRLLLALSLLSDVVLVQKSQLSRSCGLTSDSTLHDLNSCGQLSLAVPIVDAIGLDLNERYTGVLWSTVVLSIFEITEPCLHRGVPYLPDLGTILSESGLSRDGSPVTGGGLYVSDVNVRVVFDLWGLISVDVCYVNEVGAVSARGIHGTRCEVTILTAGGQHGSLDRVDYAVELFKLSLLVWKVLSGLGLVWVLSLV